jgi:tetratricopeptide (TPR) repeat protein
MLWKLLGLAEWAQGKDALPSLQRASELMPDDAEAHGNLGNAFRAAGQLEKAVASHRRAISLESGYAEPHNNLGSALLDLGRTDEAIASFRRAVAIKPDFALAHANLGNALTLGNRPDEADASCRRALELDPRLAAAVVQLGEIAAARGRFDEAEKWLKRAIAIEPDMPEAWAGLARLRKMKVTDTDWLTQAQRIAGQRLSPRREVPLRYALGKYFDDVGEYEQAFENYRRANDLSNRARPEHELAHLSQGIDRIIRTHTREWLNQPRAGSNPSARPVFIVGMPRSGTTLAEQILASHADVFGAGELDFWSKAAAAYGDESGLDEPGEIGKLAEGYLAHLAGLAGDSQRVVDKMPGNFMYLGLIRAALPGAHLIHMRRDPIDTCLSIYFHDFGRAHPYAGDLNDLAAFFAEYSRLMDHWRTSLSQGALLEVPYEDLVQDQEGWSRKMVEFIGLPWDPNCMEFHRTRRTVSTHSKWQARQKLSNSSVGRWRNYEKFVGPLLSLAEARAGGQAGREGKGG